MELNNIKRGGTTMKPNHPKSCQSGVAEELWLRYFNRYLYETGTISIKEYAAMSDKIAVRCGKKQNKN